MGPSRRFHLVLQADLEARLRSHATHHGQSLAESVRSLAAQALTTEADVKSAGHSESPGTLATLVAAELAILMVASVLPEGQRRMHELSALAEASAEQRLSLFKESAQ